MARPCAAEGRTAGGRPPFLRYAVSCYCSRSSTCSRSSSRTSLRESRFANRSWRNSWRKCQRANDPLSRFSLSSELSAHQMAPFDERTSSVDPNGEAWARMDAPWQLLDQLGHAAHPMAPAMGAVAVEVPQIQFFDVVVVQFQFLDKVVGLDSGYMWVLGRFPFFL